MAERGVTKNGFNIRIESKVHPSIFHTARVDLNCYEKMPKEKEIMNEVKKQWSLNTESKSKKK